MLCLVELDCFAELAPEIADWVFSMGIRIYLLELVANMEIYSMGKDRDSVPSLSTEN